jgi:hypothetical protein
MSANYPKVCETKGVIDMARLALAMSMLAGVTALCSAALADSTMVGPTYIGGRAADPEDETFAYLVKAQSARPLAFVGPARKMGTATGEAERDTIAYQPLPGVQSDRQWSFVLVREWEASRCDEGD